MKFSELACKQVIDIENGAILGHIHDCEMDEDFVIKIFIVTKPARIMNKMLPWFFPCEESSFYVCNIVNIGADVILVKFH